LSARTSRGAGLAGVEKDRAAADAHDAERFVREERRGGIVGGVESRRHGDHLASFQGRNVHNLVAREDVEVLVLALVIQALQAPGAPAYRSPLEAGQFTARHGRSGAMGQAWRANQYDQRIMTPLAKDELSGPRGA
jgi:hypothetical protein